MRLQARQARDSVPACAVLLLPAGDCTLTSYSMVDNASRDPVKRLANLLVLRRHDVPSAAGNSGSIDRLASPSGTGPGPGKCKRSRDRLSGTVEAVPRACLVRRGRASRPG
jgi:hypothetical protein